MFSKNKKNNSFLQTKLLLAVFWVVFGIGFFNIEKASAGTCYYQERMTGVAAEVDVEPWYENRMKTVSTKEECDKMCQSGYYGCNFVSETQTAEQQAQSLQQLNQQGEARSKADAAARGNDPCSGIRFFGNFIKCLLLEVLKFMGSLLQLAATIFAKFVDPQDVATIGNQPAIYDAWTKVRDVLNVSFIMVLLFSAFCTVFQVDKFNYKAVLRTLIIMALLVNFSFPIARWIIDFSNVLMTYLLNNLGFGGREGNLFGTIADNGGLAQLLKADTNTEWWTLIADIVFVFLLAITLLAIGALLLIRLVVLTILVIFSPVAFVGSIVPFFSSQAGKWWDALFQQSFFGPIMIFMLYLAMNLMTAINVTTHANVQRIAGTQSINSNVVASMALLMVPIVILWIGLGFAQELKVIGAGMVMGQARKVIGKVGNWVKNPVVGAAKWGTYKGAGWVYRKSGIPGGVKKRWDESFMGADATKKRQEKREGRVHDFLGGKTDPEKGMKNKADEYKKNNESTASLSNKAATGDTGAAYRLAVDGGMDERTYASVMANPKISDSIKKEITNKTKEKNVLSVLQHEINSEQTRLGRPLTDTEKDAIYSKQLNGMTADQLSKQKDLHEKINSAVGSDGHQMYRYIFDMAASDPKFHEELFKKLNRSQRAAYISNGVNP